jgi:flagellar biosynthetic protein FlhB
LVKSGTGPRLDCNHRINAGRLEVGGELAANGRAIRRFDGRRRDGARAEVTAPAGDIRRLRRRRGCGQSRRQTRQRAPPSPELALRRGAPTAEPMADTQDTGQERNLPPTAKRLADARKEGQVARSRDLAHLLVLGAGAALLIGLASPLAGAGVGLVASGLRFDAATLADPSRLVGRLADLAGSGLLALAPILVLMVVAAVAAPLAVGGWLFVPSQAAPKASRLDPLAGFKRMLSLRALVELFKVMLLAGLLGAVGFAYIVHQIDALAGLAHESLPVSLAHFGKLLAVALGLLVAVLAVSAAIDVPFQLFEHHKKLKMTLEEVRRENKETEGDPHLKARIRKMQLELARRRMMAAVPTADVVVTNPTHYAVALRYADGRSRAPVVVAKGADSVAERIREIARSHGVPRLEAPPLARALHRHVEIGDEIPAALYTAVAQVLAYVFQLKAFAAGRAPRPVEPTAIEVPAGMDPDDGAAAAR